MVVPDAWIDRVLALRYQLDLYPPASSQAVVTCESVVIPAGTISFHSRPVGHSRRPG
jgi:hypothetical protein